MSFPPTTHFHLPFAFLVSRRDDFLWLRIQGKGERRYRYGLGAAETGTIAPYGGPSSSSARDRYEISHLPGVCEPTPSRRSIWSYGIHVKPSPVNGHKNFCKHTLPLRRQDLNFLIELNFNNLVLLFLFFIFSYFVTTLWSYHVEYRGRCVTC